MPLTWSIVAGGLPTGLSIDGLTGSIAGVASSSGTFNFTGQVKDSAGSVAVKQFTLTVVAALTIVTPPILSGASVGAPYSQPLVATGGVPPLGWSISAGQLPPGLTLDPSTGVIGGTASALGVFNFTAQVSDSNSNQASKPFTISAVSGLTISTAAALTEGPVAAAYLQTLTAAGGQSPFVWSIEAGSIAPGLALDPSTGVISGITASAGTFVFTVQVSDAAGSTATKQFTLNIASILTITNNAVLPDPVTGVAYTYALAATGGVPPYSWALVSGSLPDGLMLDESIGAISGTPGTTGLFTFFVQVSDMAGAVSTQQFSLTVDAPPLPALSLDSLPSTMDAAQQVTLNFQSGGGYPLPIAGTVNMQFIPDPGIGVDDPAVQFATGGRSISFILPANSTQPVPPLALQTGTVAGTIELDFMVQGAADPGLSRTITIVQAAPIIRNVEVVHNSTGFELRVTGYSTARKVTQANLQFAGANLQTTQLTVPLAGVAANWYQSAAATPFGSQFSLTMPFTIQGSQDAIQTVSLTLTNDLGSSTSVSVDF